MSAALTLCATADWNEGEGEGWVRAWMRARARLRELTRRETLGRVMWQGTETTVTSGTDVTCSKETVGAVRAHLHSLASDGADDQVG